MTVRALPRAVSPAADLVSLLKPRLSSLVLCTLAGGMWLAGGELSVSRWVGTLLGTAGTVGAANALNCWLERDRDRYMARTALRPLPSGRMESGVALGFGILLAVFSLPLLALASNGSENTARRMPKPSATPDSIRPEAEEPDGDAGRGDPRLASAADGLDGGDRPHRHRRPP